MKNFFDKQITVKSIIFLIVIVAVICGGTFLINVKYKELQNEKTKKANDLLVSQLGELSTPINGRCRVISLNYEFNGKNKTEQIVNIACAKSDEIKTEVKEEVIENPFQTEDIEQ